MGERNRAARGAQDRNQPIILADITDLNHMNAMLGDLSQIISVADASTLGDGFPDLVIGYQGGNHLIEVKDPEQIPSKRRLNPRQLKFHNAWRGETDLIWTTQQLLDSIGYSGALIPFKG